MRANLMPTQARSSTPAALLATRADDRGGQGLPVSCSGSVHPLVATDTLGVTIAIADVYGHVAIFSWHFVTFRAPFL
jgi:hypothetical protein